MTATAELTRTTISVEAAKLATTVAEKDGEGTSGYVLVEDEHVVATDGRRMVVIAEPHADGLFSQGAQVALVPQHALKDAAREADRVSVETNRCTTLDEHGKSLRFVPFETPEGVGYPEWRKVVPKRGRVVARLDPGLLGDVCKALASAGCTMLSMQAAKADGPVLLEGELGNGQSVSLAVMPMGES